MIVTYKADIMNLAMGTKYLPRTVKQNRFGEHGNCLEACIASIVDCDLGDIPTLASSPIPAMYETFLMSMHEKGYAFINFCFVPRIVPGSYTIGMKDEPEPVVRQFMAFKSFPHIVVGRTLLGTRHAVVAKDENLLWCPSAKGHGIMHMDQIKFIVSGTMVEDVTPGREIFIDSGEMDDWLQIVCGAGANAWSEE